MIVSAYMCNVVTFKTKYGFMLNITGLRPPWSGVHTIIFVRLQYLNLWVTSDHSPCILLCTQDMNQVSKIRVSCATDFCERFSLCVMSISLVIF